MEFSRGVDERGLEAKPDLVTYIAPISIPMTYSLRETLEVVRMTRPVPFHGVAVPFDPHVGPHVVDKSPIEAGSTPWERSKMLLRPPHEVKMGQCTVLYIIIAIICNHNCNHNCSHNCSNREVVQRPLARISVEW